jgi:hypothetical protein
MTTENRSFSRHQFLIVSCGCELPDTTIRAAKAYAFSQDVEDGCQKMAQRRYACVVVCFDPTNKDSIVQLQRLQKLAKADNIPLATTSLFNPSWIENLMDQFGVAAHFKSFPEKAQIAEIAAQHGQLARVEK